MDVTKLKSPEKMTFWKSASAHYWNSNLRVSV